VVEEQTSSGEEEERENLEEVAEGEMTFRSEELNCYSFVRSWRAPSLMSVRSDMHWGCLLYPGSIEKIWCIDRAVLSTR
jgi:hypothetical protein